MALSDERIEQITGACRTRASMWLVTTAIARAIEAEARRDALEEAAKVCDQEASEWDKCSDGHVSVQSIATAIRKLKEDIQ